MKPLFIYLKNHMDPLWRRPWARSGNFCGRVIRPYVEIEEAQLRAWLDVIERTPLKYSVEQVLTLRTFLERNPEELPRMRRLADEGKLGILGGGETVIDTNMVCGESLIRAHFYALRWQEETFGTRPRFAIYPDTFGLSAQLPQIVRGLGYEGLLEYHRIFADNRAFWRGLDGSLVWFDRNLGCEVIDIGRNRYATELPTALRGGCETAGFTGLDLSEPCLIPEAELIELFSRAAASDAVLATLTVEEMPPHPALEELSRIAAQCGLDARFVTLEELATERGQSALAAQAAGEVADIDPRIEGNTTGTGCYVSRIELKQMNRRLESLLLGAETMAAFFLPADRYPARKLERLWNRLALFQFHDSLPASHSDDAYEELLDVGREIALGAAQVQADAGRATRPSDNPNSIGVFNPLGWEVAGAVHRLTFELASASPGHRAFDADGRELAVLRTTTHRRAAGCVVEIEVAGLTLPPLGFASVRIEPLSSDEVPDWKSSGAGEIANEAFRVAFDTSGIASISESESGRICAGAGTFGLSVREDIGSPWETLTQPIAERFLFDHSSVTCHVLRTPHEESVRFTGTFHDPQSQLERGFRAIHWEQTIRLIRGVPRVHVETLVDWDTTNARLIQHHHLPFALPEGRMACEIPFGVLERPAYAPRYGFHMDPDGTWPALNFVSASDGARHVTLLNRGLPAHRAFASGRIEISLLRSPQVPVYAQQIEGARNAGSHRFETALMAGDGDWRTGRAVCAGAEFNTIFPQVAGCPERAPQSPVLSLGDSVVIAAFKRAADGSGDWIVRLVETHGQEVGCGWSVPPGLEAEVCNLLENPVQGGDAYSFRPWEIKTVRLRQAAGVWTFSSALKARNPIAQASGLGYNAPTSAA